MIGLINKVLLQHSVTKTSAKDSAECPPFKRGWPYHHGYGVKQFAIWLIQPRDWLPKVRISFQDGDSSFQGEFQHVLHIPSKILWVQEEYGFLIMLVHIIMILRRSGFDSMHFNALSFYGFAVQAELWWKSPSYGFPLFLEQLIIDMVQIFQVLDAL